MSRSKPFLDKLLVRLKHLDEQALEQQIRSLAQTMESYETLLHELEEGIVLFNSQQEGTFINRQAEIWLNVTLGASSKRPLTQLITDPNLHNFLKQNLPELQGKITGELTLLGPREIAVRVHLFKLGPSEDSEHCLVMSPMTRESTSSVWQDRMARIESLIRLTAGLAHEIGNPLNAIAIHLNLLKKEIKKLPRAKSPSLIKTTEILESETKRLDMIVRQFLKATRKSPLRYKLEDLNAILENALEFLGPEFADRNLISQFRPDRKLPLFMMDREKLYQAFINLIKNAMEAMSSRESLTLSVSHKNKIAVIRFKDNGRGINEEDLPHIFDAYYTTKKSGSGLGLMAVCDAIQDHGGKIEVDSKPGQGTTFTLFLPIRSPKLQLPTYASGRKKP